MIERIRNGLELASTEDVGYARKFRSEETARAVEEMISEATSQPVEAYFDDDEDGWFILIADLFLA